MIRGAVATHGIKGAARRAGWVLLLAALLMGGTYLAARHGGAGRLHLNDVRVQVIADGAELVQARLYRGAADAGELAAVHLDPATVEVGVVVNPDRLKLAALAPEAQLIMNGGYFTPRYRPTGLLVSDGDKLSSFVPSGGPAGSGVLVVDKGRVRLYPREKVQSHRFDDADLAIQAGPRLIEADGSPGIRSDDGQHANRSFIGADTRGWLVLGVVYRADGGVGGGPSLFELQQILEELKPHTSPVVFALNLDGGPSTGMHLRTALSIDYPEAGAVYSALTVRAQWP